MFNIFLLNIFTLSKNLVAVKVAQIIEIPAKIIPIQPLIIFKFK